MDDIPECFEKLFAAAETLHAKMKANPDDKELAGRVKGFEERLQAFVTHTIKAADAMTSEADELAV